jgi:parallel beta-helix repeat protein
VVRETIPLRSEVNVMRRILAIFFSLSLAACGGGGGGGGSTPSQPDTFYVRANAGDDGNDGMAPDRAFRTIGAALSHLTDGDTVIVGPGLYQEAITDPVSGIAAQPVTLIADTGGLMTGDPPGPAIVDATNATVVVNGNQVHLPALRVTAAKYIIVDGFTLRHGGTAGVQVRGSSSQITVRDCEISENSGDGVLLQDSSEILLFNNLVHDNSRRGIAVAGTPNVSLINNTVAINSDRGVFFGSRTSGGKSVASTGGFLRNNIVQDNKNTNIQVDDQAPSSLDGYDAQFNVVSPPSYQPPTLPQTNDINDDALFVDSGTGDFHLQQAAAGDPDTSPAVDAGVEENAPNAPSAEFNSLRSLSTASNNDPDQGTIDIGYHYPPEGTVAGSTFYVRASGNDGNDGRTPEQAFASINAAVTLVTPGDTIVVGPGRYVESIIDPPTGSSSRPITFFADPTGLRTGDDPGAVVVDANNGLAPFRISKARFITVDGFTLTGGSQAGIQVRSSSSNITVRNCEAFANSGDGILMQDSTDVVIFNNLSHDNSGGGIVVGGTAGVMNARIVNNTSAGNGDRGIRIGTGTGPSTALVQNNIIADNGNTNLQANTNSAVQTEAHYNLVSPDTYTPSSLQDPNDVNVAPDFVGGGDFRLANGSPAIDAGDPGTDPTFINALSLRTTSPDDTPDTGRVDLGYHYPR